MEVEVNKTPIIVPDGSMLTDLLQVVENLPKEGFAIALNNKVISKDKINSQQLTAGDKITIIKAFYGG